MDNSDKPEDMGEGQDAEVDSGVAVVNGGSGESKGQKSLPQSSVPPRQPQAQNGAQSATRSGRVGNLAGLLGLKK